MTHDPKDVETLARLLCEAVGANPDHSQCDNRALPNWHLDGPLALGLLDALQAKGWKITDRVLPSPADAVAARANYRFPQDQWEVMHDASPICPRGGT